MKENKRDCLLKDAIELFKGDLKEVTKDDDPKYIQGCQQIVNWLSELQELKDKIENKELISVPKSNGYIVHENHVDEVSLEFINTNGPEPIYVYSGECTKDQLPFGIELLLKEIEGTVISEDEAYEKLRNMKGGQ